MLPVMSIKDFVNPISVMILKNYALLHFKEATGTATEQEIDMIARSEHCFELVMYYESVPYLKPFFPRRHFMNLNFFEFTASLVKSKYGIPDYQVIDAINVLLCSAYNSLNKPVNNIVPTKINSAWGDVIACIDLSREVNLLSDDFIEFDLYSPITNKIACVPKAEVIGEIREYVWDFYLGGYDMQFIRIPYFIDGFIEEKANAIYNELLYYNRRNLEVNLCNDPLTRATQLNP